MVIFQPFNLHFEILPIHILVYLLIEYIILDFKAKINSNKFEGLFIKFWP